MNNKEIRPVKNGRYSIFDGGIFCLECNHFTYEFYVVVNDKGVYENQMPRYCGFCGSKHAIKVENDE